MFVQPWPCDHARVFHPRGPTLAELLRQALASTRRGYDLLAPKFDWTPFRTPVWLLDAVAPHLGAPGSLARAVDLCCGTGAAIPLLRPLCRELVVGVDFSLGMLAEARRQLAASDATPPGFVPSRRAPEVSAPVRLVQQDALALGFREAFDLATIFGALGHVRPAEQRSFLAQVRACLAPGGALAFVTAPLPPLWSPALWLAAGFDTSMWVRNRLWRPPFVMYYLAWPLPRALRLLREARFAVELRELALPAPLSRLRLVLARRE
jgi:SAM-dependent methyltransferase